jgi:hypothetical protein
MDQKLPPAAVAGIVVVVVLVIVGVGASFMRGAGPASQQELQKMQAGQTSAMQGARSAPPPPQANTRPNAMPTGMGGMPPGATMR